MTVAAALWLATVLVAGQVGEAATVRPETAFLMRRLGLPDALSLVIARADLNGDGRPETIAYVADPTACGIGGCLLYVLSRVHGRVRLVTRTTIAKPPIWLLSTRTHGWRDLAFELAGGGAPPRRARLRFRGWNTVTDPNAAPTTAQTGEVLITRDAVDRVFTRRRSPTLAGPPAR